MNPLERIIYLRIAEYPFIRIPIVKIYQRFFSLFAKNEFMANKEITIIPGSFFGFHDKCPWCYDNKMILSHKYDPRKNIDATERNSLKVGFYQYTGSWRFFELGQTTTWNWQQGSGLQWLGSTKNIIYNDCYQGECVSKIIDVNGKILKILPGHIASVSSSGGYALSYCYQRLGCGMSGYGYNELNKPKNSLTTVDTLSVINIETNQKKPLFELNDLIKFDYKESMRKAYHFFSHCLFSKNGERFVFFHRWLVPNGRLYTRMFSSDLSGCDLHMFQGTQFSHIAWKNEKHILAYCKPPEKPIGLYLLKDHTNECKAIDNKFFVADGHPQFSNDGRYILIDTYPDRSRYQFLKVYDLKTKRGTVLAKLRIPFEYRLQRRCDFHPRWSRDDKMICFDSAHTGTRSLCILQNIDNIWK